MTMWMILAIAPIAAVPPPIVMTSPATNVDAASDRTVRSGRST